MRSIVPDAHVVEQPHERQDGGAIAILEKVQGLAESRTFLIEPMENTEGYLTIRERDGGRVVTMIEFLSPANKMGAKGTRTYLKKQRQVLRSNTNLVEIDFVRADRRIFAIHQEREHVHRLRTPKLNCRWMPPSALLRYIDLIRPIAAVKWGFPIKRHMQAIIECDA